MLHSLLILNLNTDQPISIRIYINDELDEFKRGLHAAERLLLPGGKLAAVTFHSLEDSILKDFMLDCSGATRGPGLRFWKNVGAKGYAGIELMRRRGAKGEPQFFS